MPKVSVIMPTFNRKHFLKSAIESVLLQQIKDIEIVVTDNDSVDGTKELVNSFDSDKIIYSCNEKNIGVVNNYNKALELSTGEYIYIFSDDDIMLDGNILKKVEMLEAHPSVGLVHSNIRMINEVGQVIADNHWASSYYDEWQQSHRSNKLFKGQDYFKILYEHWNIISMPSVLMRRSILNKVGEFNTNTHYFCDWDLWMRICLFSDVYYLDEKLIDYRLHTNNTIIEINQDIKRKELILVKKLLFEKYPDKLSSLGFVEQDIVQGVESQISQYPINSVVEPRSEKYSILQMVKNKFIKLIS